MSVREGLYSQVEAWVAGCMDLSTGVSCSIVCFERESGNLSLQMNGEQVQMVLPDDAECLLMVSRPEWCCNDINSQLISETNVGVPQVLDKLMHRILKHNLKRFLSLSQSQGSLSSSFSEHELEDVEEEFHVKPGEHFQMSRARYHQLREHFEEVEALLNEGCAVMVEDLGCVKLTLSVAEMFQFSPEHAQQMGFSLESPVILTLKYDAEVPSVVAVQPGNPGCWAVEVWFRDLVRFFHEKLRDDPEFLEWRPRPPDVNAPIQRSHSEGRSHKPLLESKQPEKQQPQGFVRSLFSRMFSRKKHEAASGPPLSSTRSSKKPKMDAEVPPEQSLDALCAMGFDVFSAYNALSANGMGVEDSVNALLASPQQYSAHRADASELHASLRSMGRFSSAQCCRALISSCFHFDAAVSLCLAEQEEPLSDQVQQAASALLQSSQENVFFKLLEYLSNRLGNISGYCIACHEPHNCICQHGVVCSKTICIFRWEDQNMSENLLPAYLCPFEDCGRLDLSVSHAAFLGQSISELAAKTGISAQTLLEMTFHHYLDFEAMKQFFKDLKLLNISKITNVLNASTAARFERRMARVKAYYPEGHSEVAYHGTRLENIEKIQKTGFLLEKLSANTGNRGAYGAGIYCSHQIQTAASYGGTQLLVCAVVRGRVYKTGPCTGAPLKSGYDSHESTCGSEWVIFQEQSILPCYAIFLKPRGT